MTLNLKQFESGPRAIDGADLNAALGALNTAISTAVAGPTGPTGAAGPTGPNAAANVITQNVSTGALVLLHALPTSDPAVANALWNDLGIVRVSAG